MKALFSKNYSQCILSTIFFLLFISYFNMTLATASQKIDGETEIIRAKIGIQVQSQNRVFRAKSRERMKPGDLIRLYVHPEKSCYVYIVHSDGQNVNLLNMTHQEVQSSTLILPSAQAFFEFDGKSKMEQITIICSPQKLQNLSGLAEKGLPHERWIVMEKELIEKSQLLIDDEDRQRFAIAGNVRGLDGVAKNDSTGLSSSANTDAFLRELQIFSGNGLLVKTYAFKIKK